FLFFFFFFFIPSSSSFFYSLSLHDALPISLLFFSESLLAVLSWLESSFDTTGAFVVSGVSFEEVALSSVVVFSSFGSVASLSALLSDVEFSSSDSVASLLLLPSLDGSSTSGLSGLSGSLGCSSDGSSTSGLSGLSGSLACSSVV